MSDYVFSEAEVLALAREAYTSGQASFDIVVERCALLVIDLQDEFVKPGWTSSATTSPQRTTRACKTPS
jgi:hypothetical protein